MDTQTHKVKKKKAVVVLSPAQNLRDRAAPRALCPVPRALGPHTAAPMTKVRVQVRVMPRPRSQTNKPGGILISEAVYEPHPLFLPRLPDVTKMARRRQAFQNNPELQRFVLPRVRPTGIQLGVGSYGSVEELEVNGLVCAGKRLHEALLEQGNAGVAEISRKYLLECQVTGRTAVDMLPPRTFL